MKSKLTTKLKDKCIKLAKRGFSDLAICKHVNISKTTLYSTSYSNLLASIKEARADQADKVFDDLIARSENDVSSTATIFLAKQLRVFTPNYVTSKPKTADEASNRIAQIYIDVSNNELDADRGDRLISYLNAFIKSYEISDIESRLEAIEKGIRNGS